MKTQRQRLTNEQKEQICDFHCTQCKLSLKVFDINVCYKYLEHLTKRVKDFWNEEIEL